MQFLEQRQAICEIGRRMYGRQFCSANEGNISMRVGPDLVLCTPTLHCKGFLSPADLCLVDLLGTQVAGEKKRTSEIFLHLRIYRERPDVDSVVHCHPPHVTPFAMTREPIPFGVLPEPDIFLGEVPMAPYCLPGTEAFAATIVPFVQQTQIVVLANHGVVSFDQGLERAYWLTEILDSYCRMLINTRSLGPLRFFTATEQRELLDLRLKWGFHDQRAERTLTDRELVNYPNFGYAWAAAECRARAFPPPQV